MKLLAGRNNALINTLIQTVLFLLLCMHNTYAEGPEYFRSGNTIKYDFPWSDLVRVGNLLFIAGQVGDIPGEDKLVKGGIGPETEQALKNLKAILASSNANMNDVVKCTIYLVNMKEWEAMNKVYRRYFDANLPARAAVGVNELALGAQVEIECIAYAPEKEKITLDDETKIRTVIALYTQGTYEGDAQKLRSSFHPKAVMNGSLAGQILLATPESFITEMQKAPIRDSGTDYQWEIANLDFDGKVASVTLTETGFPNGVSFTNYFHLIDDGMGWKIISKAFHSH